MGSLFIAYITGLVTMLGLDLVWLQLASTRLYKPRIWHLMSANPDLIAAGIFYLIYIFWVIFFVVAPALRVQSSLLHVFLVGAFFGLVAYATFDLTSQALLRDWSWTVTLLDLIWGALLTGTIALVSVLVTRYFS